MNLVKQGSKGPDVKFAQERLVAHGFNPGKPDGLFGAATTEAVKQFQASNHLPVDGTVGDQTWNLLLVERRVAVPPAVKKSEKEQLRELLNKMLGSNPADTDRRRVVEEAINTVGWKEQPEGSNGGPEIDRMVAGYYDEETEAKSGKPPWCGLAVSWWLRQGLRANSWGGIPFGRRFGGVSQIISWAHENACYFQPSELTDVSGAIFVMSRVGSSSDPSRAVAAGHTGIVVGRQDAGYRTVEGNVGNAVSSCFRGQKDVLGLVRWWSSR